MFVIEDLEEAKGSSCLGINPIKLFDIAKAQGRPLYASAPMVRYSKLAFRQTVSEYGTDLTWTPMILAKEFNRSVSARDSETKWCSSSRTKDFTTSINGPPTVVQFGCNSPIELSRATTLLAPYVNGVDVNCGCPQSWACAEMLGAALMHKRELVAEMIKEAKFALRRAGFEGKKTVSVKIRIHKDLRDTIDFINTIQAAGVDFITIHGRMRSTPSSQPVNLEAIKILTSHTTVPTLSNGDIFSLSDATKHADITGADGVMSARGILQNPALFSGLKNCPWEAVELFINKAVKAPMPFKLVLHHLSEMVGSDRAGGKVGGGVGPLLGKEQRMQMMECKTMLDLIAHLDGIKELRRLRSGFASQTSAFAISALRLRGVQGLNAN